MADFSSFGKTLMILGAVLLLTGALLAIGPRIPFFGQLPGDILVVRKGYGFYFPIVTCILLSVILSVLLNLFSRR